MRKYGGRGRGRGRGGPAGTDGGGGGASDGSAKSSAAPKAGVVQPAFSSGSRRSGRLPFLGVGKPLLKPEHQEQVLAYMAETASSSFASSSEISKPSSAESVLQVPAQEARISWSPLPPPKVNDAAGCTSGDSLELFSHTMCTLSSEIFKSPVQDEEEMEFSDAQPLLYYSDSTLTQSTALPSQCTEPDTDPDETQVPLSAHYTTLQCDTEEGGDEIEEEAMDDPVVDPDWHPVGEEGAAAGTSEEEEDPQQASTSQVRVTGRPEKGVTKAKRIAPHLGQMVNVAQRANPEKIFHTRKSAVWHFFDQHLTDETKVICKKCGRTFSRGKNLRSLNTSCMLRHVNTMHLQAWTEYKHSGAPAQTDGGKQRYIPSPTVSPPVSTPPARNLEVSLQGQSSQGISMFFHRKTASGPSPPPPPPPSPSPTPSQSAMSTASSTICTSEVQLTLAETLSRTRKYSASHPRTRALNAYIAKLISFEMMPFRLVESAAFRDLMAYAVPRYDLPSRYFFSRKAIPALHLHVKDRIVHALKQSVSGKVHLTTDAWTSRHGQGRYVSITAHWVNVVDAGDSMGGTVLPSPRSRQQLAVGVRPSSSSFSSSTSSRRKTSSPDCSRTSTPSTTASLAHEVSHYRTASGKRQQALLRMMSLGDKRHTAEVLADYLQRETESWLGSLHLEPGKVVSDNGRNFVAAIALAKLTHVPCLAHTLNLVVQCFINHYPDLQPLLQKVRRLCSHIRRSPVDSSRMQRLQRSLHLPNHRLIIDVATRWNSTMHMVERLCEQRQAVMQLWEDTRAGSFRAHIELSGVQWSRLKDVCKVLQCFEECTRLVSADNAIISMTIPLVRLLMKTLTHIKDQASAAEEEEADDEEEGSLVDSQAFGREGVLGHEREYSFHTQSSAQATVQDEVEEEEEEEDEGDESFGEEDASHGARETVGLSGSGAGFVRDCRDVDFAECAPPTATGSASLTPGTLAHMCDYLLRILKRDPRVSKIMKDDDYWLATILDPRYKDKLTNIMPQENVELILANKKTTLVDRLLEAFPAHSSGAGCTTSRTGPHGTGVRGAHSRTGVGDRGLMTMLWSDFSSPTPTTGNTASIATDRRQQMSTMVQNYLASPIDVLPHSSFPFDYWACKLDTWPELAQYALQELACPVGSVLSERVFSAAGSVLTEKRTRLSTQNVGDLTFIKMNHAWVSKDFVPPSPDDDT